MSVLKSLPVSFGVGWGRIVLSTRADSLAHISGFPVFSFLSPLENVFCEIFQSKFLLYFLTMKSILTGMLGELGAW